jgi:hypothetical protein
MNVIICIHVCMCVMARVRRRHVGSTPMRGSCLAPGWAWLRVQR